MQFRRGQRPRRCDPFHAEQELGVGPGVSLQLRFGVEFWDHVLAGIALGGLWPNDRRPFSELVVDCTEINGVNVGWTWAGSRAPWIATAAAILLAMVSDGRRPAHDHTRDRGRAAVTLPALDRRATGVIARNAHHRKLKMIERRMRS
jgi:hypothetical protein